MKIFGFILLGFFVFLVAGGFLMFKLPAFGSRPDQSAIENLKLSPQYSVEEKIFLNRSPDVLKEMRKNAFTLSVFKEWFSKGIDRVPNSPLPEIKPDLNEFLKPSADIKVIWFGHSTFMLNVSGKTILVDPVFSGNASPFSFAVKRFQKPVLSLTELPPIDFIVISHDHYDHLDMESIRFFANQKAKFLTPLGVGSHLIGWGVDASRIEELDWWQIHRSGGFEFIATPAQHFSGRDGINENETLWASWIIRNDQHNIYFSGDSGYDTHFKTIGDKYGPFDIAFIENGQYNEKWKEVHVLPQESIQAYFDLKAKRYFPVHWGMFELAFHPWYEPIKKVQQLSKERNVNMVTPKLGQIVTVNDDYKNSEWWDNLPR